MSTLEDIELAVQKLPSSELAEFRRWFTQFDEAAWDSQIESDIAHGKLDALAAEALAHFESGEAKEL